MALLQYDNNDIEEGCVFYFEGRYYTATDTGYEYTEDTSVADMLDWFRARPSKIGNYNSEILAVTGEDPVNNPFSFAPTPWHNEHYSENGPQLEEFVVSQGVSPVLAQAVMPSVVNQYYTPPSKKDPGDVIKKLEKQHDAETNKLWGKLNNFRENILTNFKSGGAAQTAMNEISSTLETAIIALMESQKHHRNYAFEYNRMKERYNDQQQQFNACYTDLEQLKKTHFDIGQFSKFCDTLYKTVAIPGPKINQMDDLPKLTDFMYMQIVKHQNTEPEVP